MSGRTIKIFLVDGNPTGVMTAEIMNWTGKVVVASRSQLPDLAKREEVRRPGIYVLVGNTDQNTDHAETVYIGESDNVLDRLKQHEQDEQKIFWEKTVIVTSKDENLNKAHIKYLESSLITIAKQSGRAKLANGTNPEYAKISESDKADMDHFLSQIQMLLPVVGVTFAIPKPVPTNNTRYQMFELNYSGITAKAQQIENEFVLLSGSQIRPSETESIGAGYRERRKQLLETGAFDTSNMDYWILSNDVPFTSPTAAAAIVAGASINGRNYWKIPGTQITFSEWSIQQTEAAEALAPQSNTVHFED